MFYCYFYTSKFKCSNVLLFYCYFLHPNSIVYRSLSLSKCSIILHKARPEAAPLPFFQGEGSGVRSLQHHSIRLQHPTIRLRHKTIRLRQPTLRLRQQTLRLRHKTIGLRHKTLRLRHKTIRLRQQTLRLRHPTFSPYFIP